MNYENDRKTIQSLHSKLRLKNGSANHCSNEQCEKKSVRYEWALKKGHKYSDDTKDYLQLCKSCHRRYDWTPTKRKMAIKNLSWSNGKSNTKITMEIAQTIRKRLKDGEIMFRLAKEYGLHKTTIRDIKKNKAWRI